MSSSATLTAPPAVDRRARGAVAALFLTNGALFANLLPRYPEIKLALGLDNATSWPLPPSRRARSSPDSRPQG